MAAHRPIQRLSGPLFGPDRLPADIPGAIDGKAADNLPHKA
jgi:hypothetical protein